MNKPGADYAEPMIRFSDNPLMTAQRQRRGSWKQLSTGMFMSGLFGFLVLLIGAANANSATADLATTDLTWDLCFFILLVIYGVVIMLKGTHEISGLMAEDSASGILEFHRATPTTAWTDGLGYLIGGTSRETLMAFALAPFIVLSSAMGSVGLVNGIASVIAIALTGILYHTVGMFLGLGSRNKKRAGFGATGFVFFLMVFGSALYAGKIYLLAYLTPYPTMSSLGLFGNQGVVRTLSFFGIDFHPVVFSILLQATTFCFVFAASTRRLKSSNKSACSRIGAILFLVFIAVVNAGTTWEALQTMDNDSVKGAIVVINLTVFLLAAILLIPSITPSLLGYIRAEQRRRRHGEKTIPWTDDAGRMLPVIFIMFALLCLAYIFLGFIGAGTSIKNLLVQNGIIGLLLCLGCLCFFGFVNEYARITHSHKYAATIGVLHFTLLMVPLLLSLVFMTKPQVMLYIASISPLSAIFYTSLVMATPWSPDMLVDGIEGLTEGIWISLVSCFIFAFYFWKKTRDFINTFEKRPLSPSSLDSDTPN